MKKRTKILITVLVILLVSGAGASVFAQSAVNPWGEPVTVEGTLQLQNGAIALASGDTTYLVPRLFRYVGFIDGLKEGAAVSVQGYVGGYNTLMPTAMTVNGKTYDLSGNAWGGGYGYGFGRGHRGAYGGMAYGRRGGGCHW